jgi:hypothetical protein
VQRKREAVTEEAHLKRLEEVRKMAMSADQAQQKKAATKETI